MTIEEIAKTYCAAPPDTTEWMALRDIFMGLGEKLYNGDIKRPLPEHFKALERELERCYCSSAFISCIALSYSIVETFQLSLTKPDRTKLNDQLKYIEHELNWLRELRNDLSHFGRPSNKLTRVTSSDQRSALEVDSRKAIALVYHVGRQFSRL
ncbi:hypothetical protein FEV13_03625 [Stutzerimonas degradans]|nr:hypothetical protein FEV13_03625 [Stutzerimonas degradans]